MVDGVAAQVLALQYQLEQSQWWSAERLREHQFEQLQLLLQHAWDSIPFYRYRLEKSGFKPKRTLSAQSFRKIAIISRRGVQAAERKLASSKLPKSHGKTSLVSTSGSTGKPIKMLSTQFVQIFFQALAQRDHIWHQRDMSTRFGSINFHAATGNDKHQGTRQAGLGSVFDALYSTQESVGLNIFTPVQQQIEWLLKENPDYLLTYPSNLRALIASLQDNQLSIPGMQQIQTISETVDDDLRILTRESLGAKLVDLYSAQEVGAIALQCPQFDHYHIQSESLYVEVINEHHKPCKPGETGRVVITTLNNFATPLIRYEIGDYAEMGDICPCGRGLPVLKRIMGRTRNMLTLPSGDKVWPLPGSQHYRQLTGSDIQQAQIIQKSLEHLQVNLVVNKPLSIKQEKLIAELIRNNLQSDYHISFEYYREIQRSPSGKFEEFISEL